MATLKAIAKKQKSSSPFPVYIRIIHNRKVGYIATDKVIGGNCIAANGNLKDPVVNEYCARLILKYSDLLNRKDISALTLAEVIEYLTQDAGAENFSDYARLHISRMEKRGQMRNAKNYKLAVAHLERYLGTNQIVFGQMSSTVLKKWIQSLEMTNLPKECTLYASVRYSRPLCWS